MFIYAVTPIHTNPFMDEDAYPERQQTIFASTWRQVGRLVRAHAEANVDMFDDVRKPLHPDFGMHFEVTKGADPRLMIVTPCVTPELTVELFVNAY